MLIPLVHGQPIRFGPDREKGVVLDGQGRAVIVDVAEVGEDRILVHDEQREEPGLAFMLSRLARGPVRADADRRVPGRGPARLRQPGPAAAGRRPSEQRGPGDLATLLASGSTWTVE